MKTYMANPAKIERKWYVVDAAGLTLGRLASEVAKVLRGKNKPEFTPHVDTGDYVIVINAEKIVVTKLQHFRVPIADEIPATCTTDGMTSGWKCEKCHEFWIPQEVIPALGHDWNGTYPCQSATSACTREGCDLHFDTKQEHLVVIDPAVNATCTATGLTEGAHCGYCGEILVAQTVIPVTEHTFIVADMEISARCGEGETVPALSHGAMRWMVSDGQVCGRLSFQDRAGKTTPFR